MANQLNSETTMCVVKTEDGREVGRVHSMAKNAEAYIAELTRQYGRVHVEYVTDPNSWIIAAMRGR